MMKKIFSLCLLAAAATSYVSAQETIVPDPDIYMLGGATWSTWTLDGLTTLEKVDADNYIYVGPLVGGELKFTTKFNGGWNEAPFITATAKDTPINADGFSNQPFVYNPAGSGDDYKWKVAQEGMYEISLNIKNKTISAKFLGTERQPAKFRMGIYLMGGAVNSWSNGTGAIMTNKADGIWEYHGHLKGDNSEFRIFICQRVSQWAAFRPADASSNTLGATGFSSSGVVFADGNEPNWKVTEEGDYSITLNLNDMTITGKKDTESGVADAMVDSDVEVVAEYDLLGRKVSGTTGIVIQKLSNGTSRKVVRSR